MTAGTQPTGRGSPRDWIAWARKPGHDAFWYYRDGLAALIGPGQGAALDVGCGEGRVSRLLKELGYRVTAVDAVAEMVAAARQAGSADAYGTGPASALPVADASFDLVLAYNMLMDVEDLDAAAAELRRVIRDDGRLVVSVVHPLRDRGALREGGFVLSEDWFATSSFRGPRRARRPRGGFRRLVAAARRLCRSTRGRGLRDHRAAWSRAPDPGALPPHLADARRVPIFLWLVAAPHPG